LKENFGRTGTDEMKHLSLACFWFLFKREKISKESDPSMKRNDGVTDYLRELTASEVHDIALCLPIYQW